MVAHGVGWSRRVMDSRPQEGAMHGEGGLSKGVEVIHGILRYTSHTYSQTRTHFICRQHNITSFELVIHVE